MGVIRNFLIIPARSSSKGVINKNIRLLGGQPLLAWTIRAIQQSGIQDSLAILSTDSEVYAQIGADLGLPAPFIRPSEYADDASSALDVINHALQWFELKYTYLPERVMWLQPTSPFRTSETICGALDIMENQQANAVIGCKEIHRDLTTLFRCEEGFLMALDRERPTQTCRQQSQPLLTPNGTMYLCKTEQLLEHHSFYPPKTVPLVMNTIQSLDIDTEEDFLIAESFVQQGLV